MKEAWFKRTNWTYVPIHFMGYAVSLAAIGFMAPVTMAVIRTGHSVSDNLYSLFVYATCTAFWWKWIAEKKSVTRKRQ